MTGAFVVVEMGFGVCCVCAILWNEHRSTHITEFLCARVCISKGCRGYNREEMKRCHVVKGRRERGMRENLTIERTKKKWPYTHSQSNLFSSVPGFASLLLRVKQGFPLSSSSYSFFPHTTCRYVIASVDDAACVTHTHISYTRSTHRLLLHRCRLCLSQVKCGQLPGAILFTDVAPSSFPFLPLLNIQWTKGYYIPKLTCAGEKASLYSDSLYWPGCCQITNGQGWGWLLAVVCCQMN